MIGRNWYLGLDMGTTTVGWACTYENYELLRLKGKDAWGIREFQEAETATARRTNRISRRRRQREIARIGILKDLFHDAIMKEDTLFYVRLDESKLLLEDKSPMLQYKDGIFHDKDYTDKEYFREYKTIFHLRKALIYDEVIDNGRYARLVYLALLNMFKHRGHFLNSEIVLEGAFKGISISFHDLMSEIEKLEIEGFVCPDIDTEELLVILKDKSLSRTRKKERICSMAGIEKNDKMLQELVKGICGLETDLRKMLDLEIEEKVTIRLDTEEFEEKLNEVINVIGTEYSDVLVAMKAFYDASILTQILGDHKTLSEAMVEVYDKHYSDLRRLKRIVKRECNAEIYDELFRSNQAGSYSAYVNSLNDGRPVRRRAEGRKQEDFYKHCKEILKEVESKDAKKIIEELDNGSFLPKQRTSLNGVIPNQVHLNEMKLILRQAEKRLPFLNEKDETGLTVSEKIESVFSFHIPYFVGPISGKSQQDKGNGWVIRKETGRVFPWNIQEKIDIERTSEIFIERLVRRCSYLSGERVLPKCSLLYERFSILNEINNLAIQGVRIDPELKQDIFEKLFLTGKRVTKKSLVQYLMNVRGVLKDEKDLSGIDQEIKSTATSYMAMHKVFGDELRRDDIKSLAEDIIYDCTIYGDDKSRLRDVLKSKYQRETQVLADSQIKMIMGFKFREWGRLSRKFLEIPGCYKKDGEMKPLIKALYDDSMNMMELINSDEYTYKDSLIKLKNDIEKPLAEITSEDLNGYYFSAPVKRMVWQTILVIKELIDAAGCPPTKIFIESVRSEESNKNRTESRKKKFLDLYKNIIKENPVWKDIILSADENGTIRSKAMYLYLKQQGKDIYTGKSIPLENLFNKNLYDIDHIYPRSKVTDNNLENNLVLTAKENNLTKSDDLVSKEIQRTQKEFWLSLKKSGFMSEEKYKRLTRTTPFSIEEYGGFIARQLVETSQGTKAIKDIFCAAIPGCDIVFSKAGNVSDFRQQFDLPKIRILNEFHHAHDAYLNIVVGNVFDTKFTSNPLNFMKEYELDKKKNHYSLYQMYNWDIKRGERIAWIGCDKHKRNTDHEQGTIVTVRRMLEKQTPILSRRSFCQTGKLFDLNIINKDIAKEESYIPVKSGMDSLHYVSKYGGYANVKVAYAFLVESDGKKGVQRSIEFLPIMYKDRIKTEKDLEEYCKDIFNMKNPKIKVPMIKIQSLLQINGYRVYLNGKTNNRISLGNATQLSHINHEDCVYLKEIITSVEKERILEIVSKERNNELFDRLLLKLTCGILSRKPNSIGDILMNNKDRFRDMDIKDQCNIIVAICKYFEQGYKGETDLRNFGGSRTSGAMTCNKVLPKTGEFLLIEKSPAGLYEKRINLLTV